VAGGEVAAAFPQNIIAPHVGQTQDSENAPVCTYSSKIGCERVVLV
jgi:hypothetical protein